MSMREKWSFEYTAAKLAEAAKAKREHHASRLKWWEGKKEEVIKKIRESGIEVHNAVAELYSNSMRGIGPQVVVDATMQRDLSECQGKITEHADLIRDYAGWIQVLEGNPESRLSLDHEDYLFFYGE